MVIQGLFGHTKQSFHMEDIDVLLTGKSSEHHLEVINVGFLPKGFKAYQTHHFSPMIIDHGGISPPPLDVVKYYNTLFCMHEMHILFLPEA